MGRWSDLAGVLVVSLGDSDLAVVVFQMTYCCCSWVVLIWLWFLLFHLVVLTWLLLFSDDVLLLLLDGSDFAVVVFQMT